MQENKKEDVKRDKDCECPYCDEPLCPDPGDKSISCKVEFNKCPVCQTILEKKAAACPKCGKKIV